MSELETARAGVFLSILALTLTWLLLRNGSAGRPEADVARPLAVCASTHGAICEPIRINVGTADVAHLGEIEVTAARLPTPLGRLVVVASRLPAEPLSKVRLAETESTQSVVVH
ncbi:MAG TPA: hypothetical protein VJ764_05750 [Steroidobacteraceae bacterium]|nr:hypothetical protein [Steroidobacteraceae bacterium]